MPVPTATSPVHARLQRELETHRPITHYPLIPVAPVLPVFLPRLATVPTAAHPELAFLGQLMSSCPHSRSLLYSSHSHSHVHALHRR
jgi:hypothetical protein